MNRSHIAVLGGLLAFATAACSDGSVAAPDGGDGGGLPDICNTPDAGDTQCELNIIAPPAGDAGTTGQQFFIDHVGKTLWLWIQLPASVPPQTLFSIVAGYNAANTPVDLSFDVYAANTTTAIAPTPQTAIQSATGKPGIIEYTFSIDPTQTPPGSLLWVKLTDLSNTHDDVHASFSIYCDSFTDPDPNSATTPTVVSLAAGANGQTGSCANVPSGDCEGVLSTDARVDTFTVTIPAGSTPSILYTDVTAATTALVPPPLYDLAFKIVNASGTPLNSGNVPNIYTAPNLASAVLVQPGETYSIEVFGLDPTTLMAPAAADPRITYSLTVLVLPNLDTNAGSIADAFAAPIAFSGTPVGDAGLAQPQTGRLSYLGQSDWFYLTFPDTGSTPTRLHYQFTPADGGGRFPALGPTPPDRIANLMIDIPTLSDGGSNTAACLNDPNVCPQNTEAYFIPDSGNSYAYELVQQLCTDGDGDGGALCLLSAREESQADFEGFAPLQNFEGIVPLQGTGAQSLLLQYQSTGSQFADDVPYALTLDWEQMPNPLSSQQNPLAFGTLGSALTTQSGQISVGGGYLNQYTLNSYKPPQQADIRGQEDYDATLSTADVWEVDIPSSLQGASEGASWQLGWSVTDPNGGTPAESLILSVVFCTADGACNSVAPNQDDGLPGVLSYSANDDLPWWDYSGSGWLVPIPDFEPLFQETALQGGYSVQLTPFACTCVQPNFLADGKFYVTVLGADRTAWTDSNYTLSMGLTSYPSTFAVDGGASYTCPVAYEDGGEVGCQFTTGFN